MPSNPKSNEEKLRRVLDGWERLAPDKTFGGMTLAEFKAVTAPSLTTRQEIEEAEAHLKELHVRRDQADEVTTPKVQQVVAGVLADPEEGPDSPLYEALGYTRQSDRHSGLTRKGNKTTDNPTEK
jgi:hypothetical protein